MNKKGFLIGIIVIGIFLILGFFWFVSEFNGGSGKKEIENKIEDYLKEEICVPATCCHADSCVPINEAPDCKYSLCTSQCEPETMDCGAGSCEMIGGNCEVKWNE